MADECSALPTGGDCRSPRGSLPRRKSGSQFSWSAPSPSPDEVAGLERRFPEVIQLPTEAIDRESVEWSSSGVIVRSLSRWVPPEALLREFRRAGLAGRIDSVSLAHRTLMLKFELPAARDAALSQPWIVNGQPIAVEPWRPDFVPAEDALRTALLWIRLPNLPIEYWNEETLRSILSVAGHFVGADVFTKERRRGSFARASVRVDLSKPLRPGARFRAHGSPFWQQFSYEHVDGICSSCGSLHLSGPCSSSMESASAAAAPLFGPWMAAIRHRKPAAVSSSPGVQDMAMPEELKDKGKGRAEVQSGMGSAVAQGDREGWRKPGKVSRRRTVPSSSLPNVAFVHSGHGEEKNPCRHAPSVPVTVPSEAVESFPPKACSGGSQVAAPISKIQRASKGRKSSTSTATQVEKHCSPETMFHFNAKISDASTVIHSKSQSADPSAHIGSQLTVGGKVAENPFLLLGSDCWAGCSKSREDANPASLKRARAIEFNGPRMSPKAPKGKGRVPSLGKSPSVVNDPPLASGPPQGKDDHERAVSALKDALAVSPSVLQEVRSLPKDQSGVAPMESVQQPLLVQQECLLPDQGGQVQNPDSGVSLDMVMSGAQGGA